MFGGEVLALDERVGEARFAGENGEGADYHQHPIEPEIRGQQMPREIHDSTDPDELDRDLAQSIVAHAIGEMLDQRPFRR